MTNESQDTVPDTDNDSLPSEEVKQSNDSETLEASQVSDNLVPDANTESEKFLDLPSGEALTPESSYAITRANKTRLIILAGAVESGKTTLLSSIYEIFQDGPFSDYYFAGSKTLLGFEQRSHDSRLASERTTPTTEHTKIEEEYRLLHLRVRNKKLDNPPQDILFTDISGELFKEMRDSTEECKRHSIFLRMDHFVLLLDGEKLCNVLQRDKVVNDASLLLRRFLDAEILGKHSLVDILFAKWDIIQVESKANPQIQEYVQSKSSEKFEKYSSSLGRLRIANVAARPDATAETSLTRGYGLSSLFKSWIEESPTSRISRERLQLENLADRQIDRYYLISPTNPDTG